MLLVCRLGADLNEQIAALLHDVSHTAFSHVIDYVFDDHNGQNYHEDKKEEFIGGTDIPEILGRHGLDWHDFMHGKHFPLLEQPSPALCADRLDYLFRDLEFLKLAKANEIDQALSSLVVVEGKIVVNNLKTAQWLAYTYLEADRASWSNFREVGLYQVTAEAIKCAKQLGFIEDTDLWGSDNDLWLRLRSIEHPDVKRWINLITPDTRFTWNEDNPLFCISTKVRSIDPSVIVGSSVTQLSSLDSTFARYKENYVSSKQGLWPMGIVGSPSLSSTEMPR